jgi:hypothetical protein
MHTISKQTKFLRRHGKRDGSVDHPGRVHLSVDEIEARQDAGKQAIDCNSTSRDHRQWQLEVLAGQSMSDFPVHIKIRVFMQQRLEQPY